VTETVTNDRRKSGERSDRRRKSRGGRRADDPRPKWRRLAWLFAAYAVYLSIRSIPAAVRRFWRREAT
jgi:hypothetical protein